jgi:methyltransferase
MVSTATAYFVFMGLTGIERLVELRVGRRNYQWSMSQGGVEYGQGHWPWMVLLHTGFLVGCVAEAWLFSPPFHPIVGPAMLVLAVLCQALRWWCIRTLGHRWNPRVVVIRDAERATGGPYRFLSHPNYVAVALEGVALPMIYGGWRTAIAFTVLNGWLMFVRIRCENKATSQLRTP